MKKKILPDGSIELEGEPEELAEYEKNQKGDKKNENKRKGKHLLTESRVAELIEEALEQHKTLSPHVWPTTITPYPLPWSQPTITPYIPDQHPFTWTSKISLNDSNDDIGIFELENIKS